MQIFRLGVTALVLSALTGCQDRVVYWISIKHGIATVEVRAENVWRDGIECSGATQCAQVLDGERKESVDDVTKDGATVTASGFTLRGDELDLVIRYTIPVEKLSESGQLIPITVQRPSDVRAGRVGVPSLAVMHLAGSPTTVEMKGPSVRMTGDIAQIPGATETANAVGTDTPDIVVDVLSRGRGKLHVVVPSTNSEGVIEHHDAWIQTEAGLAELLKINGMLI